MSLSWLAAASRLHSVFQACGSSGDSPKPNVPSIWLIQPLDEQASNNPQVGWQIRPHAAPFVCYNQHMRVIPLHHMQALRPYHSTNQCSSRFRETAHSRYPAISVRGTACFESSSVSSRFTPQAVSKSEPRKNNSLRIHQHGLRQWTGWTRSLNIRYARWRISELVNAKAGVQKGGPEARRIIAKSGAICDPDIAGSHRISKQPIMTPPMM